MENITQLLPGLLAVKMPDNASEFYIFNDEEPYIFYWIRPETDRLYLPPGFKYTLIGKASEVKEEMAATILPLIDGFETMSGSVKYYENYLHPFSSNPGEAFCFTALESFQSLLINKQCFSENPYGSEPYRETCHCECHYSHSILHVTPCCHQRKVYTYEWMQWQQAKSRVGTWIIIKCEPK